MSFTLKLDVSAHNLPGAFSLCDLVKRRMESLHQVYKDIEGVEINLFENLYDSVKGVTLRIQTNGNTVTETSSSKNWEDAIAMAYEKVSNCFFRRTHVESIG